MMNEKWEEQFREQIHEFVGTIEKFDKGEIDRKAYKGISGGFGSYAQHDPSKHMLRLRMAGGNLTEKRLEFLTEAVKDYGVELMKLTTCETVQLHNLKAEQVPVLMEKAIASEIYSRGGGGDNPRNIMMSPLSGVQKGEAFDVKPYAEAAAEYLLSIAGESHSATVRMIPYTAPSAIWDLWQTRMEPLHFASRADSAAAIRWESLWMNMSRRRRSFTTSVP